MGYTSLQSRYLSNLPTIHRYYDDPMGRHFDLGVQGDLTPLRSFQSTSSYRTTNDGSLNSDIDIAASQIATRNGFGPVSTRYDNGHEFFTSKRSCRLSHPSWTWKYDGFSQFGPLIPARAGFDGVPFAPETPALTDSEVSVFGARAIARTAPTRSAASLATFLGELISDGLPSLVGISLLKNRASVFRNLGSEYLNVQFGWAPLISDVKKIVNALANASKIIRQYESDSGKVVRRRYYFDRETTSDSVVVSSPSQSTPLYGYPPEWLDTSMFINPPILTRDTVTTRRVWFSGAYSYYLDSGSSATERMIGFEQKANHLLGTRLTPEVLWELTPWSWLADWVGDIGNVLTNATLLSQDGLVLRYGYLMCHTVTTITYRNQTGVTLLNGVKTGPLSVTFFRETKERRKATPYGFGLDIEGFTPKQWSILGALGLTNGPRSLR